MATSLVEDKIRVRNRDEVLRLHLMIKSFQHNFGLSLADINTLIELDKLGYTKEFFDSCLEKKYFLSEQTIRNAISKMTGLSILKSEKRGARTINREYFPSLESDKVILKYMIGNL